MASGDFLGTGNIILPIGCCDGEIIKNWFSRTQSYVAPSNWICNTSSCNIVNDIYNIGAYQYSEGNGIFAACFDGNSCIIYTSNTDDFNFSSNDFTIEFFIKSDCQTALEGTIISTADPADHEGIYIGHNCNNYYEILEGDAGTWNSCSSIFAPINKWSHIAYVRKNNNANIYINGYLTCSYNLDFELTNSNNRIVIGGRTNSNQYFNGKITNLHVVNGQALYDTDFSVPTGLPIEVSGTKLILNFGSCKSPQVGIYDDCNKYCYINIYCEYNNGTYERYDDGVGGEYGDNFQYCASGYEFLCCSSLQRSFVSNGAGSYFVQYSNDAVIKCDYCIKLPDNNFYLDGYQFSVYDGSLFNNDTNYGINYCDKGYLFFNSNNYEYISDGKGGYLVLDLSIRNYRNVCINWDFSKTTKSKYNFNQIDADGNDILISYNDNCGLFYEINSICNSNICILEANQCKSLFLSDVCKPFIFIRNVGNNDLCIKASDSYQEINFKNYQIFSRTCFENTNFKLTPKESIILSLTSSHDGQLYYSIGCYPFGFFYEFLNVSDVNPMGLYPSCCYYDEFTTGYIPTYMYKNICGLTSESGVILNTGDSYLYTKQLSMGDCFVVDEGVSLELSFNKDIDSNTGLYTCFVNNDFSITSSFSKNCFLSNIKINKLLISDGISNEEICNTSYLKQIDNDYCLSVVYDIDIACDKYYDLYYLDCNSGSINYDLCIVNFTNTGCYIISKEDLQNNSGIIKIKNNEYSCVYINLDCSSSIKDLINKNINRCNLYLPTICNYNYDYSFELFNSDYIKNKICSGYWASCVCDITVESGFINKSFIINCDSDEFIEYKSNIYPINLSISENRFNTNSIQDKSSSKTSEYFYLNINTTEKFLTYCCLDFPYFPISNVIYQNASYTISEDYIDLNFYVLDNFETISFPINALNYEKLVITSNFEIFDRSNFSKLNLQYEDFNLTVCCKDSNIINHLIPIVQCTGLNGYEYPNVSIDNQNYQLIQKDINFKINPLNCFICDSNYGLNNFLLFVTSILNSGIATKFTGTSPEYSYLDYEYNSTNYNFLMMDLFTEYSENSYTIPTGQWTSIIDKISFENISNSSFLSYKNNTGDGYNYIVPVSNNLTYCDNIINTGSCIVCCNINTILNNLYTGFLYKGSSTEYQFLTGESGTITGCYAYENSGANFIYSNGNYLINLNKNDITGSDCRDLVISKNYTFSGVQPIYIESNYKMLDIKYPIVCNNLNLYCCYSNDESSSGIYYYIYDINNYKKCSIKLISPELTNINFICWKDDQSGFKSITSNYSDFCLGRIQNNAAQMNLNLNNVVHNNTYIYDCCNNSIVCINILGGL